MIKKLQVNQFTLFKKESFSFGGKINVFIGENGAGKTQILKLLYASEKLFLSSQHITEIFRKHVSVPSEEWEAFKAVFKTENLYDLVNLDYRNKHARTIENERLAAIQEANGEEDPYEFAHGPRSVFMLSNGKEQIQYGIRLNASRLELDNTDASNTRSARFAGLAQEVLFLPARELLTIYPNYQSLSKRYHLPYDQTYDDTIAALGLPYQKEESKEYASIVSMLEKAIGGKIFLRNEQFYFHPDDAKDGQDLDINLTAEGWRKLGTVLQLLKNGGLHAGMVLFWDEPEANLNPRLIRLIARVIINLSHLDIQVFLTTHSLFLLREIDILTKSEMPSGQNEVRYFNFIGKGKVEQGSTPEELGSILLLDESLEQSARFLKLED